MWYFLPNAFQGPVSVKDSFFLSSGGRRVLFFLTECVCVCVCTYSTYSPPTICLLMDACRLWPIISWLCIISRLCLWCCNEVIEVQMYQNSFHFLRPSSKVRLLDLYGRSNVNFEQTHSLPASGCTSLGYLCRKEPRSSSPHPGPGT